VTVITDHNTGGTVQRQSFTYDALDRLLTAGASGGTGGTYSETYTYWPSGRMDDGPLGANYSYNTSHLHAVATAGGNSYNYDANGNMTSRTVGGQSYTLSYDAENRLVTVSGATSGTFVYAPRGPPDNQRVKGTVGGVTTYYIGKHYEVEGGVVKKYYYAGDRRIAMRSGGALYPLLGDHLGSTAYTISGTTETGELRYKAFGATRFTSGTTPTTFRYTGQREEAGLGLYYYGARWYDPALGHFLQADTLVPEPGNVLDYHRYSYTRFNPLKYNDPTGHFTALTQRAFSPGLGGGAALPLSGGNKVALTIAGSAGAAATLDAGLAAGSPPSQADALAPLLESFPGQTAGASSTSFPLADGGPQTSIPPSTGVYNNTLNVLADPLPVVDPTRHIYAASSGVALANTANQALHQLPGRLRAATVAASRGDDGEIVLAVYGRTRENTEQAVTYLRGRGWNVLDAPSIRTSDYHAERQLYEAGYTEIGISRQAGMCNECGAFFRDKPHVRIIPYKPQH
jgi:RHS repeat-associated protein